MSRILANRRLEIIDAKQFAKRGIEALSEERVKFLQAKPLDQRGKMCEEDLEALEDDEQAMHEGLRICQTSHDLGTELETKLRVKFDEYNAGKYSRKNSTTVTFGNNTVNNGILVGNNAGQLAANLNLGAPEKET